MKCYDCGGEYEEVFGILQLENEFIGKYEVPNVKYLKCSSCQKRLFPYETLLKIETIENDKKNELLKKLPIEEFIYAAEAAQILNISRQALHKHKKIRRGFIYSIKFGGRYIYHKESVQLFKETGDGRLPLCKLPKMKEVKYIIKNTYHAQDRHTYKEPAKNIPLINWQHEVEHKRPNSNYIN